MPTIFTHGLTGYTIKKLLKDNPSYLKLTVASIVCAMLPDADVIGFAFHIPYESMFGHRGFTHSVFFAVLVAIIVQFTLFRNENLSTKNGKLIFLVIFCSTVSHPIFDMFTNGGHGVALFAPFSNHRYFFPWFRPILVSPIGVDGIFSGYGLRVLFSELLFIGLPCLFLLVLKKVWPLKDERKTVSK